MVNVGKVVTRKARIDRHYDYPGAYPANYPGVWTEIDYAVVGVDAYGLSLSVNNEKEHVAVQMEPEQAIELAQLLMKAAESQVEYAASRKELQDEMEKLDAEFKDRISGLGIDGVEEPEWSAKKKPPQPPKGGAIIVEGGW